MESSSASRSKTKQRGLDSFMNENAKTTFVGEDGFLRWRKHKCKHKHPETPKWRKLKLPMIKIIANSPEGIDGEELEKQLKSMGHTENSGTIHMVGKKLSDLHFFRRISWKEHEYNALYRTTVTKYAYFPLDYVDKDAEQT